MKNTEEFNTLDAVEKKSATFQNWQDAYKFFQTAYVPEYVAEDFRNKYDPSFKLMPAQCFEKMFNEIKENKNGVHHRI